ncbi:MULTISPECIES: excisionase family DNA-binding protein [Methylosinus]|uniref:excisionase family DNA-binding protein n=1 Tax=Methylosinus TaxID=425 RepID=UPI00163DB535|nr:excisionase family DNA-binding protein [Methylosinus sporium]MBU3887721.1 helix-turn-helix domain-containing protein [Methylosinus sp. KRF6]
MTVGGHRVGDAKEESEMSNQGMAVEGDRPAIGPEASRAFVQITPAVLNPREAAKYIGVGRTKFFELLKDGAIPMKKSGKHTLVKVSDLDAWIDGLPSARTLS